MVLAFSIFAFDDRLIHLSGKKMLTVQFNQFPEIETNRLLLRQPTQNDADVLFRLRTNEVVMKYIGRPKPQNREEVVTFIDRIRKDFEQSLGITWIISTKKTGIAIGTMGLWRMDKENHRAEIGYLLDPEFQGLGMAAESMHAVLKYGFQELNFHSIEANVDPLNEASKKLLLRAGFVQEGYFRESYFFEGKFLDSAIFGLLCHAYKTTVPSAFFSELRG
jgi:ribosomal-protein-alanine N-acetyltransferase